MDSSNVKLMEKFIDYCSIKNKTISRNIANIGTENYQRQDVEFKDILNSNISSQSAYENKRHIKLQPISNLVSNISVVNDFKTEGTGDINNVDIEKEMAELAKNTLNYRFATRKISSYYKNIQSVIRGGSGQ